MRKIALLMLLSSTCFGGVPGWTDEGLEAYFMACYVKANAVMKDELHYRASQGPAEFCGCLTGGVSALYTQSVVTSLSKSNNEAFFNIVNKLGKACMTKMSTYKQ